AYSNELYQRAKKLIPGGVNSPVRAYEPYPFFVKRAEGSKIYDVDGNSYVDYVMGYGALLLGHSPPKLVQRLKDTLEDGFLYCAPTEKEVLLAEKIKRFYRSIEMVRLVNSGLEATLHAIRLARGYTNRKKILKFEGCYHGSHDSVLVKAGSGALTFGVPSSLGVLEDLAKHTLISRFNDIELTEKVVRENKDDLAAIIVEPVMANAGLIKPRRDFLLSLRELADYSDAILIFDEVVTGFRLALGGAQEYYEIEADLTTLGKVLGGGLPISAFGGREDIMKNLSPIGKVYQAGTYSGNPLSTTAALTVLDILEENPQIYCEMRMKVDRLCKEIKEFIEEMKLPLTVNHIESMFQIFFIQGAHESIFSYEDVQRSNLNWFKEYFLNMLNNGVFLPPSQFETCFLSASHTDEDIEKTIGAIKESLSALKR
ncbi:MAG: glutamate-1-semialdehyde 2,1-aminomutase, partial [Nitrososphaerota archaeon]|nr:glutamate-1-semialdehyde 2,1-aminomutase [Nitrososphaerales archaeon]MDW8045599.1 glutamate-1-semialdehyde 2,1-aminomutase [Nitrososphaerota archaeon]